MLDLNDAFRAGPARQVDSLNLAARSRPRNVLRDLDDERLTAAGRQERCQAEEREDTRTPLELRVH